ncbi:hypothetical protein MMC12_002972 [Toensbergia leucococca]|nr:hypothetical protein [Toensbergia leucococca]
MHHLSKSGAAGFLLSFGCLFWLLYTWSTAPELTPPDVLEPYSCDHEDPVKRIAIIGAGAGGASSAYYINKFKEPCMRVNITVYERSSYVGGRSTTINVFGDAAESVELGASIFVDVNRNLVSAAREFDLLTEKFGEVAWDAKSTRLGVWDGESFVFIQDEGDHFLWNLAKLIWKYGLSPVRAQNLMKKTVGTFLKMYEPPWFPFRSLSQTAYDLGLTAITSKTGDQFLIDNQIQSSFAKEIIQASTRVNYAQNLEQLHGLETMVCMATDGAMSIKGGNWQIFDRMLKTASASVVLNTSVSEVNRRDDSTYTIKSSSIGPNSMDIVESQVASYDTVIIAGPLQFSDIILSPPLSNPPDEIPYVELHVTLFASQHRLSPQAFNLPAESPVPDVVLTTVPSHANLSKGRSKPGLVDFFSISLLRTVINPTASPPRLEYLYKIFSPKPLTSSSLAQLLGFSDRGGDLFVASKEDISWHYEKIWKSYPYLYPRVTFDDPQLDTNLWYTSGIESFISTMETSSLMGMNVARLVVDDWLGIVRGKPRLDNNEGHGTEI